MRRVGAVTILIDPPLWPRHGYIWGHLVSDSSLDELHTFASAALLPRRSFDLDHYDVPAERYAALIALGAELVDSRELVRRLRASGLRVRARDRARPPVENQRTPGPPARRERFAKESVHDDDDGRLPKETPVVVHVRCGTV